MLTFYTRNAVPVGSESLQVSGIKCRESRPPSHFQSKPPVVPYVFVVPPSDLSLLPRLSGVCGKDGAWLAIHPWMFPVRQAGYFVFRNPCWIGNPGVPQSYKTCIQTTHLTPSVLISSTFPSHHLFPLIIHFTAEVGWEAGRALLPTLHTCLVFFFSGTRAVLLVAS